MKAFYVSLVLFLLLAGRPSQATTFYQSAPSYNSAFQTLVNQARAGDIIILRKGDHFVTTPTRLPAGKDGITIRGEEGAVVRKRPNSYNAAAFEITGNGNTIDLIELDGGNLPEAGIIIYGQHNTVSNSRVHNCGTEAARGAGILLDGGQTVCCCNIIIGCQVYYNYMVGISQSHHSDGIIRDNQIYENGAEGLTVDTQSQNNYVYNNGIHRNNTGDRGVGTDFSNGTRFDSNVVDFTHFRSGLTFQNNLGGCDGVIVSNNHINNNEGYGILERWTQNRDTNLSFQNNELLNNRVGAHYIIDSGLATATAAGGQAGRAAPRFYPNPAREAITLELGAVPTEVRVAIRDLQGRLVLTQTLRGAGPVRLDAVRGLSSGTYLLTTQTAALVSTRKLIMMP